VPLKEGVGEPEKEPELVLLPEPLRDSLVEAEEDKDSVFDIEGEGV